MIVTNARQFGPMISHIVFSYFCHSDKDVGTEMSVFVKTEIMSTTIEQIDMKKHP